MIILRADNRVLTTNTKFAYFVTNSPSGSASADLTNVEPFIVTTPILLGEIGKTDAEILKVRVITDETISFGAVVDNSAAVTNFAHPESTKVSALQYDQIRFYWTAAAGTIADENPTFDENNPLTAWTSLDPTSNYSTYTDVAHDTGFGWFKYRNVTTLDESQESNPIPYVGFTLNTAQQVFLDFDSLLNTNELKLVSINDKFSWLNEAIAMFKLKLNLTNVEYTVSTPQTISITGGVSEYLLPTDFSDLVEITTEDGIPLDFQPIAGRMYYEGSGPSYTRYYLRGRYIGFTPTPVGTATYYYTYRAKATRIISPSTYIDLPDDAFYSLKDWMVYRAYSKFNNPLAATYYQTFKNSMDLFIQASVKRNANLDSWSIECSSNT
jgi:hypothetical protein